jgi:hypothetical protein
MGNINFGRVLLGGLVAGLVLNIGEFILNDVILGAQMKTFFAEHKFPELGNHFMMLAIGLTFVMGIVLVLGYAAIRPRFGAGAKTAIVAGLFAWFAVYVYCGLINGSAMSIPASFLLMGIGYGLVEYVLAALAGAWLYKEA